MSTHPAVRLRALERQRRRHVLLALFNFLSFALLSFLFGGDAFGGDHRDGRYFLGQKGVLTEVSFGVWLYSWLHTASQILTFPLAFVAIFQSKLDEEPPTWRGSGTV